MKAVSTMKSLDLTCLPSETISFSSQANGSPVICFSRGDLYIGFLGAIIDHVVLNPGSGRGQRE